MVVSLDKYFPDLSAMQLRRYAQLEKLYGQWNDRLNLISRRDFEHFHERHLLHSLALARFFSLCANMKVIDLGTGGGFPGIPLAIHFPQVTFTLVDSVQKKLDALAEIVLQLELKNVILLRARIEQLRGHYELALGRAVAPLPRLLGWLHRIEKKQKQSLSEALCYWSGANYDCPQGRSCQNFLLKSAYKSPWFASKALFYINLCNPSDPPHILAPQKNTPQ